MNREDIVAVAVRLLSIYVFYRILVGLPSLVQVLVSSGGAVSAWMLLIVLVPALLLCAGLWCFPLTVAKKLLPARQESGSEGSIDASLALSIGLMLIGVWLLATALGDLVYWGTVMLWAQHTIDAYSAGWALGAEQVASIVATIVQLLLSLWLIFGSVGIRRLIERYRFGKAP